MAKLPSILDVGPADRAAPTRGDDVSALTRGAQALAQGAERLGAGVQQAGAGLAEMGLDESRWQYTKAHADFLTRKIDLDAEIGQDRNYGPDDAGKTLPQRYSDKINGLRNDSADLIQDPGMRQLFMAHTASTVEQGVVAAQAHARALSNDAQLAYVDQMGSKTIDQAVAAQDDATRTQLIDTHNQLIDGLVASGAIGQERAVQMKREWAHQYAVADITARAQTDPQGVVNELRAAPGSPEAIDNRIAQVEGRGKNARSSADGVGQFIDSTWVDLVKRNRPDLAKGRSDADILLLRRDENLGRDMVSAYRKENTAYLEKQGLEATPGNIYLAHFLGPGGAAAVLKADPNMPVQDALAKALGPDKAKQIVDANPSVLMGQLSGSVKEWADGKMGGVGPGGSRLVDMLRPDVREQLLANAQGQLQKQNVQDIAGFKSKIEDSQAEANRTGNVTNPLTLGDFVSHLGADVGPKAFAGYQANIQVAHDAARVGQLNPDELHELVQSYEPKPGAPDYAAQVERQDMLRQAAAKSLKERGEDPAGFAIQRLAGSGDAYRAYAAAAGDPTKTEAERGYAARNYAATTLLEQQQAGIPASARQVLPAGDVERFKGMMTAAADADDPKARVALISQIQAMQRQWGDYWPQVMQQLGPSMRPVVRAIAAGADTEAMTRLLSLGKDENPAKILKEQNETKAAAVTSSLNSAFQSYRASLLENQRDAVMPGYYDLASKLAALYVRDGDDAGAAATKAFNAVVGSRYDFKDTFRIPKDKDAAWTADQVQAGSVAALRRLDQLGARPAINDMGLEDNVADSMSKYRQGGVWVTEPGERGLNLAYLDHNANQRFVLGVDGQRLMLNWATLAKLAADQPAVAPNDAEGVAPP